MPLPWTLRHIADGTDGRGEGDSWTLTQLSVAYDNACVQGRIVTDC